MSIFFLIRKIYLTIIISVGKTTFALDLVRHQHFTKKIKNVHYFGCLGNQIEKLDWDSKLPDVAVHYHGKKFKIINLEKN